MQRRQESKKRVPEILELKKMLTRAQEAVEKLVRLRRLERVGALVERGVWVGEARVVRVGGGGQRSLGGGV